MFASDNRKMRFYATVFSLIYIFIIIYFHVADIYNHHFFEPRVTAVYNLVRCLFCVYLFAAICVPGYAALSAIGGSVFAGLRPLARLTAAFFCGAALWHALLLLLGFLNLYFYPIAVALSLPAVAFAPICLGPILRDLSHDARDDFKKRSSVIAWATVFYAGGIFASAILLLIVKGLFPAGGHDYFNHYHGYYEAVLQNHGLWPNDVWYQFYYSKGMGLFFLAIMLTDPLAPSLVTYCFAIASAMALFLLIDRMSLNSNFWPWTAVIIYFVLYSYTPGLNEYRLNGGWGDFQKPHEIDAAFVVGFLWLCSAMQRAAGRERRMWFFAAAAAFFFVSTIELITVLIFGLFTSSLMAIALIQRRWSEASTFLALSVVGGIGLLGVLALNYLVTGLPSDQFAPQAWPWANVQILEKWGALPYVILLIQGLAALKSQGIHWFDWQFVEFNYDLLRIDLLRPLLIKAPIFLVLLGGAAILRLRQPHREQDTTPLGLLAVFLMVVAVTAAVAGGNQQISFFRYTSFLLPIMIGIAACGWLYINAPIRFNWLNCAIAYVLPSILLAVALGQFWTKEGQGLKQILPNAMAFADGTTSIRQAYADQQGWPGRQPWGGIFPGMVGAWKTAGPGTRIWSMHLGAYCMLPHCRSETFYSFILSPHLLDLLVEPPEEIRDTLRAEGLNYFFFTTEMDVNDVLPLTKLFAPDQIAEYLGIKWTDGSSYLLTWLGPGVTPLTSEWVAGYRKAVARAPYEPAGFPLGLMLNLREQLRRAPRWGRDLEIHANSPVVSSIIHA